MAKGVQHPPSVLVTKLGHRGTANATPCPFPLVGHVDMAVGNKELVPHLPQVRGGMSGQEQQERMHVTERDNDED